MANQYRNFSQEDYTTLIDKYDELLLIREAAVALVGKEDTQSIIRGLQERGQREKKYKCPAHLCLGMTPSKRKTVEETWSELVQNVIELGARDESVDHVIAQMSKEDSIEGVRENLLERKKSSLHFNGEKINTRSFSSQRGTR